MLIDDLLCVQQRKQQEEAMRREMSYQTEQGERFLY
jgi:hypothetical protein